MSVDMGSIPGWEAAGYVAIGLAFVAILLMFPYWLGSVAIAKGWVTPPPSNPENYVFEVYVRGLGTLAFAILFPTMIAFVLGLAYCVLLSIGYHLADLLGAR